MQVRKLHEFHRGWVIGDFHPSILNTKEFEMGVMHHPKGEQWPFHTHLVLTEYNILVQGDMTIQGVRLTTGDVFILHPGDVADPEFHEDCTIVCVKVPSVKGDKVLV